jgi:hypothetical protein
MPEFTASEFILILLIVIGLGGGLLAVIVHSIAANWRRVRIAEQEAVLKKEMIDRGFTPEQIVQILGIAPEEEESDAPDLLAAMVEAGYEGDDIRAAASAIDRLPPDVRDQVLGVAAQMAENSYDGSDILAFLEARAETAGASPADLPART